MGKAWKFSDNLNTDEIIPARYNMTTDEMELAKKVFCEIKPEFAGKVKQGDLIVAGNNFGCGSSREHAPLAIRGSGVKCVIAKSYARIFFRNAITMGLAILECREACDKIGEGDEVQVDLASGIIKDIDLNKSFKASPLPHFILKISDAGGIINFLRSHDMEELEG